MRFVLSLLVGFALSSAGLTASFAADRRSTALNANAIGLVSAQQLTFADSIAIAHAVDHVDSLRVLPIAGNGSLQSLNDLLFLKGVDVAIVSSDSLGYARKHALYKDEADKLAYLAKLANSSIVIISRKDITSATALAGRKVAAGPADSDSFIASDLVFGDLGTEIERVALSGSAAITAVRDGVVDAAVLTTAESMSALAAIEQGSNLHILPFTASEKLAEVYAPAIIDSAQLPNLIADGKAVETVAAALVMSVVNWPKGSPNARKLAKFEKALVESYFSGLSDDKITNFSAAVPGWRAFGDARQSAITGPASGPVVPVGTLVAFVE